jgi:hypothetical protein
MWSFLDKIPYSILIVFSIIMILIPFKPMPHFVEKLIMLKKRNFEKTHRYFRPVLSFSTIDPFDY